eukprot:jgi/Phyca11/119531/e_gw1.39.394.1
MCANVAIHRKHFCNVARGRDESCFAIWHDDWNNGNGIPSNLLQEHKLRDHRPAGRPGKKHRRRLDPEEGNGSESESDHGADEE